MAARYEVEVTVASAKNLKNVNWKHGDLMPYAAVWVDPEVKCSTKVAVGGDDDDPVWDEKLVIALPGFDQRSDLHDAVLHVDIVHANAADDVKPLIGSARLTLGEIVDEAGIGGRSNRTLKLKRPSGRPHGKLELRICVRESARYADTVPYGVPYGQKSRDIYAPPNAYAPPSAYGAPPYPYAQPPPSGYPYAAPPPVGYGYGAPPPVGYGYGAPPPSGYPYGGGPPPSGYPYGGGPYESAPATAGKKSKFGMGTGLAVGAAAGVLGGLALAEGADYLEDKIADDVAERVEDNLGYDDGDF